MSTVGEKKLELPIRDYDNDSYDEVIEVPTTEARPALEIDLAGASPKELLVYFAARFKEVHGYEYVIEWVKEIAVFKSFKERYGVDAGPMVALLFDKYRGVVNDGVMTVTAFSKGSKWIQDKLYVELRETKLREENRPSTQGLMSTDDFLKRFTV